MSGETSLPPSIDLHEDISAYYLYHGGGLPLGDFGEDLPRREADLPKYRKGNVRVVFAAVFPGIESFSPEESRKLMELYGKWLPATKYRIPQGVVWEHFTVYYKMSEVYGVKIAESVEDIERCLAGEGLCFVLHLEGAEAVDDPYDLTLFKKLGLRSLGLTWNYMNKYATSCAVGKDVGLTTDGEELVKMANKLGIIIDLAHASKKTMIDVLNTTKKPVIISHANVRKIVNKPRNVDDEVLELLYRNRGVLGISAIGSLVSTKPRPTIDDLVEHFSYVGETFGTDILAIGTDFLGLLGLPAPEGFESIDKLPALYQKLSEKGFTERDLSKIAYENVVRVLKQNL
ncbi:MAG: dipeptidase [Desulfurococcaceae archaeon]